MSAPALAGRPSLSIRGKSYPVLLPTIRDPRLHLAAVIITLQVLGQTSFGFNLSIAQILVSLLTAAVLEVAITFRRQSVIMWPASALLTGNGVAFILRVPGTEHGDWWSMNGCVDLRGDSRRRTAVEVPHPVPRASHLQPVELRPGALLPAPGTGAGRSARVLVGTALAGTRARAGGHRHRRLRDPPEAAPDRDRSGLLVVLRGRNRTARTSPGTR